jgi:hypothetical protein
MKSYLSHKNLFVLLVSLFLLGLTEGLASGRTIIVKADRSGDYPTIQAAIAASNNGDTVLVADGIYTGNGNRNINFQNRKITLRSKNGPANCIIDCEHAGRAFAFTRGETNKSILDGFTIISGYSPMGGAIYCYESGPKVLNCVFRNNRAYVSDQYGGYGGAFFARRSSSPMLSNCAFIANSADVYGGGIFTDYDSSLTVTNCTLAWNSAGKPGIYASGGAIFTGQRTSSNLINCIFWGNSANFYSGLQLSIAVDCTMRVSFCNIQGGNSSQAIYIYNSSFSWGSGNISTNPMLVSNDYHLSADSSCINAGNSSVVSQPGETDIDGQPRIIGGRVDIGADEFNHLPVACIVGGDRMVEVGSDCEARIVLDDQDSTLGTNNDINDFDWYEVIDPCDPDTDIFLGTGEITECNLPLGEHIIILEVTDTADDFDSNEVVITVEDTTPPEIFCPADIMVAASNPAGTEVTFTVSAIDLCDPTPEVTCTPPSDSFFPCGETEVTCTATDFSGNSSNCTFTVIVIGPIESRIWITPRVIYHYNRIKKIRVLVKLPEGISRDDINEEEKLQLYPNGLENDSIAASYQFILGGRGRTCRNVYIIAFFDKNEFIDAVPENGRNEVYLTGKLESGQYFYGSDSIWIRSRHRRRWRRHWRRWP